MPLEYYLGGAVGVIVLILLGMALTGKRSTRRVVVAKNSQNEELTRQVARAADALEALLAHFKAHPWQAPEGVPQSRRPPVATERSLEVQAPLTAAVEKAPEPRPSPASASPLNAAPEPAAPGPVEPAATGEAEVAAAPTTEQKPRRVKLSMFGR